ncbi:MAG TPA: DNA polymerase III subunit epsilon, partial [Giesbergeria sp.]|nr:DNA polymerase III subunit epsilon [Giesbergeria sp.]
MKKTDPRLLLAIAASGLVMALWLVLMSVIVWSTLSPGERTAVGDVLASRTALVAVGWLIGLALVAGVLRVLHRRYVGAPYQLLEETRVVLTATTPQKLKPRGTAEMQALANAVNELAAQRDQLRGDMT